MKTLIAALLLCSSSAFADVTTYKMYGNPHITPNPVCDVYVQLTLKTTGRSAKASLVNMVDGVCEIVVDPRPRTINLKLARTICGSRVFASKSRNAELVDNRERLCDDVIPGLIVLREGNTTLYSYDR